MKTKKIKAFFKEAWLELKKVNWPSRKETIRYTLIVIVVLTIIALYLGGIDFLLTRLLNKLI